MYSITANKQGLETVVACVKQKFILRVFFLTRFSCMYYDKCTDYHIPFVVEPH